MRFVLPKLNYGLSDLEPVISHHQLEVHYLGHLKGYIDKLNSIQQIADAPRHIPLEEIVIAGKREQSESRLDTLPPWNRSSTLYDLAGQVYNHTFFFRCLKPGGGGSPYGSIAQIIDAQYGSFERFKQKIIAKGNGLFGSGWIWVTLDDEGNLDILKAFDAETPIAYYGLSPVLCLDVWEHAYYLDYENRRADYLNNIIDRLIDWKFVNKNLENA